MRCKMNKLTVPGYNGKLEWPVDNESLTVEMPNKNPVNMRLRRKYWACRILNLAAKNS